MATFPNVTSASDVWSLRDVYKAEAAGDWPALTVSTLAYQSYSAEGGGTTTTHSISTLPSGVQSGDLVLHVLVLDGNQQALGDGDQPTGFTFLNAGVTEGSATEYPDVIISYRIWDGTETTPITSNESYSEPYNCALIAFRGNLPFTSASSAQYDAANGPSGQSLSIGGSGTNAPAINFVFSCGRPTSQQPTLTYDDADALIETAGTGINTGNMTFGYQLFDALDTPASASVSTNDTGRQVLAGLRIEVL